MRYYDCLNHLTEYCQTYEYYENALIKLAGFNLVTLVELLKQGYTIEPPKPNNISLSELAGCCEEVEADVP